MVEGELKPEMKDRAVWVSVEAIAAEREAWRAALVDHFPMGVECDHADRRYRCPCACVFWRAEWQLTYSKAVRAWIEHVAAAVRARATDDNK